MDVRVGDGHRASKHADADGGDICFDMCLDMFIDDMCIDDVCIDDVCIDDIESSETIDVDHYTAFRQQGRKRSTERSAITRVSTRMLRCARRKTND